MQQNTHSFKAKERMVKGCRQIFFTKFFKGFR